MWRVELTSKARKQLSKLNPNQSKVILAWLKKNIDGCEDPRRFGKPLKGALSEQWRYRVGDYRILCEIHDGELIVLALNVIHRSRAYKR